MEILLLLIGVHTLLFGRRETRMILQRLWLGTIIAISVFLFGTIVSIPEVQVFLAPAVLLLYIAGMIKLCLQHKP